MSSKEVLEKREAIRNEKITMTKASYQTKIGRAFNKGQVTALCKVGKSVSEIAEILGLNESTVRSLNDETIRK